MLKATTSGFVVRMAVATVDLSEGSPRTTERMLTDARPRRTSSINPSSRRSSPRRRRDRKSTRLNSSHLVISYAVFCLKKKKNTPKHAINVPPYNIRTVIYFEHVEELLVNTSSKHMHYRYYRAHVHPENDVSDLLRLHN